MQGCRPAARRRMRRRRLVARAVARRPHRRRLPAPVAGARRRGSVGAAPVRARQVCNCFDITEPRIRERLRGVAGSPAQRLAAVRSRVEVRHAVAARAAELRRLEGRAGGGRGSAAVNRFGASRRPSTSSPRFKRAAIRLNCASADSSSSAISSASTSGSGSESVSVGLLSLIQNRSGQLVALQQVGAGERPPAPSGFRFRSRSACARAAGPVCSSR